MVVHAGSEVHKCQHSLAQHSTARCTCLSGASHRGEGGGLSLQGHLQGITPEKVIVRCMQSQNEDRMGRGSSAHAGHHCGSGQLGMGARVDDASHVRRLVTCYSDLREDGVIATLTWTTCVRVGRVRRTVPAHPSTSSSIPSREGSRGSTATDSPVARSLPSCGVHSAVQAVQCTSVDWGPARCARLVGYVVGPTTLGVLGKAHTPEGEEELVQGRQGRAERMRQVPPCKHKGLLG